MSNRSKGFLVSYTVIKNDKDKNNEDNKFRNIIDNVLANYGYEYIDETTYFKSYNFSTINPLMVCNRERLNLLSSIKSGAESLRYYRSPDYFEVFAVLASCH